MDANQIVLTVCSLLGIALVGAMAVVPSVMEAGAATGHATSAPPAPTVRRPRRHAGHFRHRPGSAGLAA